MGGLNGMTSYQRTFNMLDTFHFFVPKTIILNFCEVLGRANPGYCTQENRRLRHWHRFHDLQRR